MAGSIDQGEVVIDSSDCTPEGIYTFKKVHAYSIAVSVSKYPSQSCIFGEIKAQRD